MNSRKRSKISNTRTSCPFKKRLIKTQHCKICNEYTLQIEHYKPTRFSMNKQNM